MDPVAVKLLANLHKATKAKIVVSSTWRFCYSLVDIREFLVEAGWTDCPPFHHATEKEKGSGFRGEEVACFLDNWVLNNGPIFSYVILDDSSDFYLNNSGEGQFRSGQPLVQTSDATGLTGSDVLCAQYVLNTLPSQPKGNKKLRRIIRDMRMAEGRATCTNHIPFLL